MNLTSSIDVVFLLLIFFLVTANFSQGEGVLAADFVARGDDYPGPPPVPTNPIEINVSASGSSGCRLDIRQHGTAPRTFSQLSKMLRDMQYNSKAGRSGPFSVETPVIIKAERHVRWQHVVNAFNAAVGAGYKNVTFAHAADAHRPDADPAPIAEP